jgi:hypothetical protein
MAFEIYKPTHSFSQSRGTAKLHTGRMVSFSSHDLWSVGIRDKAIILIDQDHRIIALRAPKAEDASEYISKVKYNKSRTVGNMSLGGPMSRINEKPSKRTVDLIIRDQMVQIPFGVSGFPESKRKKNANSKDAAD